MNRGSDSPDRSMTADDWSSPEPRMALTSLKPSTTGRRRSMIARSKGHRQSASMASRPSRANVSRYRSDRRSPSDSRIKSSSSAMRIAGGLRPPAPAACSAASCSTDAGGSMLSSVPRRRPSCSVCSSITRTDCLCASVSAPSAPRSASACRRMIARGSRKSPAHWSASVVLVSGIGHRCQMHNSVRRGSPDAGRIFRQARIVKQRWAWERFTRIDRT